MFLFQKKKKIMTQLWKGGKTFDGKKNRNKQTKNDKSRQIISCLPHTNNNNIIIIIKIKKTELLILRKYYKKNFIIFF